MSECTYCGSDLASYNPVFVGEERDGERVSVGEFCNYACLSEHIDENGLADSACCRIEP